MQAGIRAWVLRAADSSARGFRRIPPPAMLAMLCASAFSPLISVSAGLTGAAAAAGFTVLSSVGGGALSGVIAEALDRTDGHSGHPASALAEINADVEQYLTGEINQILEAGDADALVMRAEIAAVLRAIDAGGTMLRAAIETGNAQLCSDLIAAVEDLSAGVGQMEFLVRDVVQAAANLQESLDEQGANIRVVVEQNNRQSADIRLVREGLAAIERRASGGFAGGGEGDLGPRWAHGCPYRGLLPFREADAEVFYGRERLTAELIVQVARGGLLVVTGASGAGKSSLLRAGLLPALARGVQIEGSQDWPRIVMTPTRHPLTELATHLASLSGGEGVAIRDHLYRDPGQAHLAVRQAVLADAAYRHHEQSTGNRTARLVLIVDQFEQIFTLNPSPDGEGERQAFISALHAAGSTPAGPDHEPPAVVVVAVRGDFCDRCAAYSELGTALQDCQFVVGPMTETDLRLAITGPADAAGLDIDATLTDTILSDLRAAGGDHGSAALPLLAQAMLLTWENREGSKLTSHGYGKAGGISLAVQTSADAVYDGLSAEQQALTRELLRAMTVASREGRLTRRPVSRIDLYAAYSGAGRSQVDAVLEAFAARRLVVLDGGTAQISHDALLSAWPRLRGWLDEDQASWILHNQLTDDATTWGNAAQDSSFLYRGTQLAALRQAAAGWASDPTRFPALTATQQDFLKASEQAVARSIRLRRIFAGMMVVLLIASVAGAVFASVKARSANQRRAEAVSEQLAAESEALDASNPVTASQLAAVAWQIARTPQARHSMLDVLAQPGRAVLASGSAAAIDLAFSPNGRLIATAMGDGMGHGRVLLWDTASHQLAGGPLPAGTGGPDAVAFSPDSKLLATGAGEGPARLWNVATHRPIGSPLRTGPSGSKAVAFSPDGKTLVTLAGTGTVRLWDVATHRPIGSPLRAGPLGADAVAFGPSGTMLATADRDGTARLWDVATHLQIGSPIGGRRGSKAVSDVAFSPDEKILATAGEDGAVRLWDVASHHQIGSPMDGGRGFAVDAVAFSPDGKSLATGGDNGPAMLWDVTTHQRIGAPFPGGTGPVYAVAFSPNGEFLAVARGPAWVMAVRVGRPIGPPMPVGIGPPQPAGTANVAFSPHGHVMAIVGSNGTVRLLDEITRRTIGPPLGSRVRPGIYVNAVAFSPDGALLATAGGDGKIRLWDVATGHQFGHPLPSGSDDAMTAAFSPDGKILVTGTNDGRARIWDVSTGKKLGPSLSIHGPLLSAVALSPHAKLLATVDGDAVGRLWNLATRKEIGRPLRRAVSVAFSPDGKQLAITTYDGTALLLNAATGSQIGLPLPAGTSTVTAVAFSPDGTMLATASDDGTARLWDLATGQQIGQPFRAGGTVNGITFINNGSTFATSANVNYSGPEKVLLWNVEEPRDLQARVCAIAGRSLTRLQWDTYIQAEPFQRTCQ